MASGLMVGESLAGVVIAAGDMAVGRSSSLALVGPGFAPYATGAGALVFIAVLPTFYGLVSNRPST